MRPTPNLLVEKYRVRNGDFGSSRLDGNNGVFVVPASTHKLILLAVIVSDGGGWEHASVTVKHRGKGGDLLALARTATYAEMDHVKRLFWGDDETVVQFHVPRTEHVNVHNFCLHLWKPVGVELPLPPLVMV